VTVSIGTQSGHDEVIQGGVAAVQDRQGRSFGRHGRQAGSIGMSVSAGSASEQGITWWCCCCGARAGGRASQGMQAGMSEHQGWMIQRYGARL
jgi:hypothetical protein